MTLYELISKFNPEWCTTKVSVGTVANSKSRPYYCECGCVLNEAPMMEVMRLGFELLNAEVRNIVVTDTGSLYVNVNINDID